MSTIVQEPRTDVVPSWIYDMKFCHIYELDSGPSQMLCGHIASEETGSICAEYEGESVCPTCGNPTCPRCAQLAAIEDALEEL